MIEYLSLECSLSCKMAMLSVVNLPNISYPILNFQAVHSSIRPYSPYFSSLASCSSIEITMLWNASGKLSSIYFSTPPVTRNLHAYFAFLLAEARYLARLLLCVGALTSKVEFNSKWVFLCLSEIPPRDREVDQYSSLWVEICWLLSKSVQRQSRECSCFETNWQR